MINPFAEINWQPDRTAMRNFGRSLVLGGLVGLLFSTGMRMGLGTAGWRTVQLVFGVMIPLGILAFLLPKVMKPLYFIWFFVSACIGLVTANLAMAVLYYLVLTPLGLILRLTGRDALQLRPPPDHEGMWRPHEPPRTPRRYYRQY